MTDPVVAAARAAGKNIGDGARTLGTVDLTTGSPERAVTDEALAARAREVLREEVARMARLREQYAVERGHGAPGTPGPRLDALAANIEGACRFALRLGLVSPGEAREIFAEARAAGLQDRPGARPAIPARYGRGSSDTPYTGRDETHPERAEGDV